jgi:hypothetical protein
VHDGGFLFLGFRSVEKPVGAAGAKVDMVIKRFCTICAAAGVAAVVAAGSAGTDSALLEDPPQGSEQPREVMTVSPRILLGCWKGKNSLGRKVIFTFSEPQEGQPAVFKVRIKAGGRRVAGICSFWENNMCDLKLETKDLQNIRSRWFFKYDGVFMTIQLGDGQMIAGSNIFNIKKE